MNTIISCDCQEYPAEAYKQGKDLLTTNFAKACIDCDKIILPYEFTDIIEEHDYKLNKE